jgi:1,6-anhydro-N-acetylmuramate kinase
MASMESNVSRHVVGAMTGTSLDGIDATLVEITGRGLSARAHVRRHVARSLGSLGAPLRDAAGQQPLTAEQFAELALALGRRHVQVIAELLEDGEVPDLIAAHGQTVFHAPPVTWQLLDPAPLAARFGCPVVCDLRRDDCAAGGAGAPITPLADWVLFRRPGRRRAVVNLGGFANATIVPGATGPDALETLAGFDVCVCNHLLDGVARRRLGSAYDNDGAAAASGRVADDARIALVEALCAQAGSGRSLGTGDEGAGLVERLDALDPSDAAATAVSAVAACLASALAPHAPDDVVLAGGGAANRSLTAAIGAAVSARVVLSDEEGVGIAAREAAAMAVLGALSADGMPITLPGVTGCRMPAPRSGRWTLPHGAIVTS